jgi:ATP-dependent helicase/nuclease subunit A
MHPYRSEYSVINAPSILSWILDSIQSPEAAEVNYRLRLIGDDGEYAGERTAERQTAPNHSDSSVTAEEYGEVLRRRFDFRYPYEVYCSMPSKLTVSKLYPGLFDDGEIRTALDVSPRSEAPYEDAPLPRFMESAPPDAAERGTATHVFMQFCDFAALRDSGTESEIERLMSLGFITEKMAQLIHRGDVEKFRRSELFSRMLSASRMWREFRFNAAMPAAEFTRSDSLRARLEADGATVTVQGVVDCMFEDSDGRIVLADYKTDRLTDYELCHPSAAAEKLISRHKTQLDYYRRICSSMLGKSVDETYIYSLPLGATIPV